MPKYLKSDEIIDLELFISEDERESEDYKKNRDFEFYSKASSFNKAQDINLLAFWIEKMRGLSGKISIGKFSQMLYALSALLLFALGAFLAWGFFDLSSTEGLFSINRLLCILGILLCFAFTWVFFGFFAGIANWKMSFFIRLIFGSRGNLSVVERKNKNYFRARAKFLTQFFGLGFALSMFFSAYFGFKAENSAFQFKSGECLDVPTMQSLSKYIALPYSLSFGEETLYPSFADAEFAELAFSPEMEILCEKPDREQGVWANFFLAAFFVYGILPRLIIFFVCFAKGRNSFGKYKILNDSDINILLNRMKLSSANKTNWQSLKNDKDCKNLLILRKDLIAYSDVIKDRAIKLSSFDKFNIFEYEFLSEFFTEDFDETQSAYQTFTIAFLSDDYNDEVFENMQNLINTYPEKTLNVLLLGRYNKASNSFYELVSVEKSWWERKLNAISTQNINIY